MNTTQIIQTVLRDASADIMREHVKHLWENNRWHSFSKYRKSAAYLEEQLHGFGFQTEKLELAMDGVKTYGDTVMPYSWDCEEATLETIDPENRVVARYSETPNLVGMWSPPTPAEGLEGDLLFAPDTDAAKIESLDATGKFILTNTRPEQIRRAATAAGALGVISYWMPYPNANSAVQWINSNSHRPGGWGTIKDEPHLILMALSPEKGNQLASLARNQTVRVRATIRSSMSESTLPLVHARIPGTHVIQDTKDNIEILLLAPLYGCGANDHAASAAALLEAARVLRAAIDSNALPRPMRGIRFLWTPKVYGPIAFAHENKAILDRTLFALCLDAGAGDPDYSWSRWSYRFGPLFQRHFMEGLAWPLCREYLSMVRPQRFIEQREFSLNADVWFNDPALNTPTHWLTGGATEECKLTTLDVPETVDPRSLIDLATASASIGYAAAAFEAGDIPPIAAAGYDLSRQRIHKRLETGLNKLSQANNDKDLKSVYSDYAESMPLLARLEAKILESFEILGPDAKDSAEWKMAQTLLGDLRAAAAMAGRMLLSALHARAASLGIETPSLETEKPRDKRVPLPEGLSLGTITMDSIPPEQWGNPVKWSPRRNVPYILAWWLMDCQRTIGDIEEILELELGSYRECIPVWFDFLERHGLVVFEGGEELAPAGAAQKPEETPDAKENTKSAPSEDANASKNLSSPSVWIQNPVNKSPIVISTRMDRVRIHNSPSEKRF